VARPVFLLAGVTWTAAACGRNHDSSTLARSAARRCGRHGAAAIL